MREYNAKLYRRQPVPDWKAALLTLGVEQIPANRLLTREELDAYRERLVAALGVPAEYLNLERKT